MPNVGTVPCHALVPRDVVLFAWVACVLPHGSASGPSEMYVVTNLVIGNVRGEVTVS